MTDINWSIAPPDATFYLPETDGTFPCWVKRIDDTWYTCNEDWVSHIWVIDENMDAYIDLLIPRPTTETSTSKWSGNGLPPVGQRCQAIPRSAHYGFGTTDPLMVLIAGYFGGYVWCIEEFGKHSVSPIEAVTFQYVMTPEELALQERQTAITKIMEDIGLYGEKLRYIAERVLDAGYIKQVQKR